jgi:hypothetical protein
VEVSQNHFGTWINDLDRLNEGVWMGYNPDRLFFDGWTTTLRLARAELGMAADGANVVAPEEFTEAS